MTTSSEHVPSERARMLAEAVTGMTFREWERVRRAIDVRFSSVQAKTTLTDTEEIATEIQYRMGEG